jgi:hypothetical protein
MTKLSEVKTLYAVNARQIPEMMRKLASEIENPPNKEARVNQAVVVIRDSSTGCLNIYGWGDLNINDSISMLSIGQARLADVAFSGSLWSIPVGGSTED